MGLLYRCTSCEKEMVLESYHRARTVPCPWCGAQETVPENLDFEHVYLRRSDDERSGRWLLTAAVVGMIVCCLPVSAIVWWLSHGRVVKAREDQREADPLLLNARVVSAVATPIEAIVWTWVAIQNFVN